MEDLLELMVKIASTTSCCRHTIVIAIVFFTIHFCAKNFWHSHHLPLLTFRHNPAGNKDTLYCVVCLYDVVDGERFRALPECSHCFHVDCIDAWFQSHSTCPLCRTQVSCLVNYHRPRNLTRSVFSIVFLHFSRSSLFTNPSLNL